MSEELLGRVKTLEEGLDAAIRAAIADKESAPNRQMDRLTRLGRARETLLKVKADIEMSDLA